MESKRQQKFSRMIQKELAEIFQRECSHLLKGELISVSVVRMSPDLGFAKVYLSIVNIQDNTMDRINKDVKAIRHALAKRIRNHVRVIPEIAFFVDDSSEYFNNIDNILNKLNIPPEDNDA